VLATLLAAGATCLGAPTIWNGPLITFSKANFANPSLAANQDRITSDLWLTRSSSQGLFNADTEGGFAHSYSPAGTEWADGTLANFATLSYHDWNTWVKGVHAGPSTTLGVQAVVHVIPDNIYFSIKFTSWTAGGTGGGFSYQRSTPSVVPEPTAGLLLLAGMPLVAWRRRKRLNH
jgi:hypothetical protein